MGYFPAFLKLQDRKILVIGGGKIASDKISHLLDFTNKITIISPTLHPKTQRLIKDYHLTFHQRPYRYGDVEGFFIVIVAVDSLKVQQEVYQECQEKGALCNAVDSVEFCDFIFPSYIKRGDLIIAFSTSGASPALSKHLRRAIEKLLPDDIEQFLKELKNLRKKLPKGKERMKLLEERVKKYIQERFK